MTIVEGDEAQRELAAYNLEAEGYEVVKMEGPSQLLDSELGDMAILGDMPQSEAKEDENLWENTIEELRDQNKTLPILLLTARSEEVDTVKGLEAGATH